MYHYFVSFVSGFCRFGSIEIVTTLPITTMEDIQSCSEVVKKECGCDDTPVILSYNLLRKEEKEN